MLPVRKSLLIATCLLLGATNSSFSEETPIEQTPISPIAADRKPEEFSGVITNIISEVNGPQIVLGQVIGAISGRYSAVRLRVDLCTAPQVCIDVPSSLIQKGSAVTVLGYRKADYQMNQLIKISPTATRPAVQPMAFNGVVDAILPPAGSWQTIVIKDSNDVKSDVQICAEWAVSTVCPVMEGTVRKVGAIVSGSGLPMGLGRIYKVDRISGQADYKVTINPPVVDFGAVGLGSRKEITVTIKNEGGVAVRSLSIESHLPAEFSNSGCPPSLEVGQSCSLVIGFAPNTAIGRVQGTMTVMAVADSSDPVNPIPIPVSAESVLATTTVFRIKDRTGSAAWNTRADPIRGEVGKVITFINDDKVAHQLGGPASVGLCGPAPLPRLYPGQSFACNLARPMTTEDPAALLYDPLYGPTAEIHLISREQSK